jgi:hypothetical protein
MSRFKYIHNLIYTPIVVSSTIIIGSAACWRSMTMPNPNYGSTESSTFDKMTSGMVACGLGGLAGCIIGYSYPVSFPIISVTYGMYKYTEYTKNENKEGVTESKK